MPEHAEVKITSTFINTSVVDIIFSEVGISSITKNVIDLNLPFQKFKISSSTRGKELKITLTSLHSKSESKSLVMGFGMTGKWLFLKKEELLKVPHVHLFFRGKDEDHNEFYLAFQDVRRFARWSWADWSPNRGPDPITEAELFKENILSNLEKKTFNGRIIEVIMDQQYFNGVGNYLRAEIIAQANINPFQTARDVLKGPGGIIFLMITRKVIAESYVLGGAQLKDWKNPFGKAKEPFFEWLKVYGKGESLLDKQKRNFWYLKKWKANLTSVAVE